MRADPGPCPPSLSSEQDSDVRSVLTRVLHTGLRQCGAIGLVGVLLYVGLSVFGLGYDLNWTYTALATGEIDQQIIVAGILVVASLSVIGLVLAQSHCSLRKGRLFGWGSILIGAAVATFEGAVRGTFSTEYVILVYLLIVAIIPFRPIQVVGIGGSIGLVIYLLGPSGVAWTGGTALSSGMTKHVLFILGGSVLITGASIALYRRHHSFGTTEASLRKSRDLLRRTQEVAGVGGWEYDPTFDTVQGTEELYDILGLPDETHFSLEAWLQFYGPQSRSEVRAAIEQCLDEGESFDLEVSLVSATDERREVRIRGTAETKNGEGTRLIGILQDITERQAMEKRLHQQERLLRSITENVSDGIYRLVPGEGLVYANPAFARLFGYDGVSEVCALDPEVLCANPERRPAPLHVPQDTARSDAEVVFQRKDDSTFVGLLSGTVVRDEEGDVEYVDGVVTDITDLKERERALKGERDRFETLFETLLQEDEAPSP
jgi:PAS domain S-box-containing protein